MRSSREYANDLSRTVACQIEVATRSAHGYLHLCLGRSDQCAMRTRAVESPRHTGATISVIG
jgi:hypothetical protein